MSSQALLRRLTPGFTPGVFGWDWAVWAMQKHEQKQKQKQKQKQGVDLLVCCRALARPPSQDTPQVRPCRLLRGIHAA
ncbi:hypothetical protein [Xanthomonas euroxanthea]|uniref:hypothetical protein n=1 Tax=Xanthomonas euroxanthea TaxID=2259622 RepID=UPI00160BF27D|nr:hypothetical protein [Xanthomonas euroxanthea]MBB5769865.1 hypothetical protein [Xanthomonas euroxanthea]